MKNSSIKEKTDHLNKIIAWFNSDDFDIEKALEKFKEAQKLAVDIEKELNQLKNEIEIVKKKFDS
ncbi:MAG: exodeoxyribonuclease VII small subunit [Candidatus Saccharimonadales bacterium]